MFEFYVTLTFRKKYYTMNIGKLFQFYVCMIFTFMALIYDKRIKKYPRLACFIYRMKIS